MNTDQKQSKQCLSGCSGQHGASCRLDVITPLAKKINCLDVKRIADICVNEIPPLIGQARLALYS